MCGFFGFVNITRQQDQAVLSDAMHVMASRGPDDARTWIGNGVGLAHCRLAIFDPSDRGAQPMTKWKKTIVFNGAIYNFAELKRELSNDYEFETDSDTEVILAAYDKWGDACQDRFNGQWAFCILDLGTGDLFASRDRFGIKPLYWLEHEGVLYFSSEYRCFECIDGFQLRADEDFIISYLSKRKSQMVCPYQNIMQLEPGHQLRWQRREERLQVTRFYQLPAASIAPIDFTEASAHFNQLLTDAVLLRMRGDVAYCSTLSGGIDSNSIASIIASEVGQVRTFSIIFGSGKSKFSEENEIRQSMAFFKQDHNLVEADAQSLVDELDVITRQQELPIASMSVLAQWRLYRRIKNDECKIAIDGQGADEYLMGYDSFLKKYPSNLIYYPGLVMSHLVKSGSQEIKLKSGEQLIAKETDPVDSAMRNSLPFLLHTLDRNSAGSGVECRVPFLDHRLVEFTRTLPTSYLLNRGVRKRILWAAMRAAIPPYLTSRRAKRAFLTPQDLWVEEHQTLLAKEVHSKIDLIEKYIDIDHFNFAVLTKQDQWRLFTLLHWLRQWN